MSQRLEHMVNIYIEHLEIAKKLYDNGMQFPGSRIAIVTDVPPDKTAGGIIIPDSNIKAKPAIGTIVGIGVDLESEDSDLVVLKVEVGQRAALAKYGGTDIELYLDGADEQPTSIQLIPPNDLYIYWDPRVGTELDTSEED